MYWMITNRNIKDDGFGDDFAEMTYWQNTSGKVDDFKSWQKMGALVQLRDALVAIANNFPDPLVTPTEDQKHITLFVHGYDNNWVSAADRYYKIVSNLFSGDKSLGECILFSWPSKGCPAEYLPDRSEARQSADDFADVLSELYDWMATKQQAAAINPKNGCRAQTSLIAHSMGNYVVQNAMNSAWTRKNRPLLMSLINQYLMVAADVDNDIFRAGDVVEHNDGEGIANLTYRATALFSGKDAVLGMSAGLKHFGKRRLGRSGLDRTCPVPDNVWDIDCSNFFGGFNGMQVHSAYFDVAGCYELMRALLQGMDRTVLLSKSLIPGALPRAQAQGAAM
jgi:esterase/lipase superfamily enzyme